MIPTATPTIPKKKNFFSEVNPRQISKAPVDKKSTPLEVQQRYYNKMELTPFQLKKLMENLPLLWIFYLDMKLIWAPRNFSKENTGIFTAIYSEFLASPVPYPKSFNFFPRITFEARSTIGIPVTLLIYGTVRLRGCRSRKKI